MPLLTGMENVLLIGSLHRSSARRTRPFNLTGRLRIAPIKKSLQVALADHCAAANFRSS
jgi:hypothetical protein